MLLLLFAIILSISYAYIGGAIKFLDNVHDCDWQFKGKLPICWGLVASIVLIADFWTIIDVYSAALTFALVIGLALMLKLNNRYFITIALATLPAVIMFSLRPDSLMVLPALLTLTPAVAIDEVLHTNASHVPFRLPRWLLSHRPIMKCVVVVLPLLGLFTFIHTLAFWSFDIAYDLVAYTSARAFLPEGTTSLSSHQG